jgi:hypothetical protein
MTKAEVQALIDSNLASASAITALKHREVETAILNYSGPLLTGNYNIGDIGSDAIFTISFSDLGTSDYIITGSLVGASVDWDDDNDIMWSVREKTATSFKLALRSVSDTVSNVSFDYIIFNK